MINIHGNFIGGNICVKEILEDTVLLENEIRDTQGDWFYWAFCVEGAQGRTLTFKMQQTRIGYWGPAVSHDLAEWSWLDPCDENSFTYSFGKDEERVYFANTSFASRSIIKHSKSKNTVSTGVVVPSLFALPLLIPESPKIIR